MAAQTMNESVFQASLVNTFGAALAPLLTALYPLDPVNLTGYTFFITTRRLSLGVCVVAAVCR
jgi:hypothetical protein